MSGKELKYIEEAINNNHVFPLGNNVCGFEKDITRFSGVSHATCLSSGTAALHLALIILGIDQDDEVICSSFTFSASVNPIRYQKAVPIFIDSEPGTWNMDPILLEKGIRDRIRRGVKPKAIILVHLYGMPAKLSEIKAVASDFGIPIIEDAAEALGSKYDNQQVGTFGDIGIYSFNGNKIITTSGGGALVSDNELYCSRATFLSTQARDSAPHYQHSQIGYNYRMSNIAAGIGRGQMEVLKKRINKRRENHQFYYDSLKDLPGITFLQEPNSRFFSNYWLTTILIDPAKTNWITREDIRLELENNNIESRPLWKPMHLQPIFRDFPAYVNGTSEQMFDLGLCLPSSSNITDSERQFVVKTIRKTL
jgi:dTDP-4-amino-4,6-dideoxygalactose transaminase